MNHGPSPHEANQEYQATQQIITAMEEVLAPEVRERILTELCGEAVREAENITWREGEVALQEVLDEAEDITYDTGVRELDLLITEAENIISLEAAAHELGPLAVFEAESIISTDVLVSENAYSDRRPFMEQGYWAAERPKRSDDLVIQDLTPGLRVVSYDDKLIEKDKHAKHEVITSKPYIVVDDIGTGIYFIDARQVYNHATDTLPAGSDKDARPVPLMSWGITPSPLGQYSTTKYIELFSAS